MDKKELSPLRLAREKYLELKPDRSVTRDRRMVAVSADIHDRVIRAAQRHQTYVREIARVALEEWLDADEQTLLAKNQRLEQEYIRRRDERNGQ